MFDTFKGYVNAFEWYRKKHGLLKLSRIAVGKLWSRINVDEHVFLFHISDANASGLPSDSDLEIAVYLDASSLPETDVKQLKEVKGSDTLMPYLDSFFKRGSHLWIFRINRQVVGWHWTLVGGFEGFYSMPLTSKDVILIAGEVKPDCRGRGLCPSMIKGTNDLLKKTGFERVYLKIDARNRPMLDSIQKTNYQYVGRVRTYKVGNRHFVIWKRAGMNEAKDVRHAS